MHLPDGFDGHLLGRRRSTPTNPEGLHEESVRFRRSPFQRRKHRGRRVLETCLDSPGRWRSLGGKPDNRAKRFSSQGAGQVTKASAALSTAGGHLPGG